MPPAIPLLALAALLGVALGVASCVFPPPIDTSSDGVSSPPAVWQASPPMPGVIPLPVGQALDIDLQVIDQDLDETLVGRLYADYRPGVNEVPAIREQPSPPNPSGASQPEIHDVDFGAFYYCGDGKTNPPLALGQHTLEFVVSDRGFVDNTAAEPRYQVVPAGAEETRGGWIIQCVQPGMPSDGGL